ncbi:hypothetical protein ACTWPB_23655 [Nocardia sp. IBHARD005]
MRNSKEPGTQVVDDAVSGSAVVVNLAVGIGLSVLLFRDFAV